MLKNTKLLILALLAGLFLSACSQPDEDNVVVMATTTSTENSGLLDYLLPVFKTETGVEVQVIAVGTGKALRMARDGDVDVLMVHAKPAEEKFVAEGYGVKRVELMYNDFIFVGPEEDPAGLRSLSTIPDVMSALANGPTRFLSRGDDSGTHKKELGLWKSAGLTPGGERYQELGQGMGKTLQIANELQAYTLIDRGTWLSYVGKVDLKIVFEGVPPLNNQYAMIVVNPERYPDRNTAGAERLVEWLTGKTGQDLIGKFKVQGQVLFKPNAQLSSPES